MKRLGLAVALVLLCAASAAGAMSKAQAKKVIADHGLPETADGMLAVLNTRSEEHTSELQSRLHLVCRLLLEKKKKKKIGIMCNYNIHWTTLISVCWNC